MSGSAIWIGFARVGVPSEGYLETHIQRQFDYLCDKKEGRER